MPSPYDHHWRTYDRPAVLKRVGGQFHKRRYVGYAHCERCKWKEGFLYAGQRSKLEIAHLDGNNRNGKPENLACVPCHKRQDYPLWAARCHRTRYGKKDWKRPLLIHQEELSL
jgi:hypothetical protein